MQTPPIAVQTVLHITITPKRLPIRRTNILQPCLLLVNYWLLLFPEDHPLLIDYIGKKKSTFHVLEAMRIGGGYLGREKRDLLVHSNALAAWAAIQVTNIIIKYEAVQIRNRRNPNLLFGIRNSRNMIL